MTDDASWFRATYDAQVSWVWHVVRRLGVAAPDVPDVTQEVFVTVFRRAASYDATRPLRPWLFAICLNLARRQRARAHVRREVPDLAAPDLDGSFVESLEHRDLRRRLHHALDTLDDDQREVIVAHDLEGLAMPAIAEIIDAPLATLYSRLRLGRARLTAACRATEPRPAAARRSS